MTSKKLLLEFNAKKCSCAAIGPASKFKISDMILGQGTIDWSDTFKYLGVHFTAGTNLAVDLTVIKRKFYMSCNCILGNSRTMDDIVKLNLIESYCLPVLTYATEALRLTNSQLNDLNACWNSVYRRIFGFNRWESVRAFISGLGRLDFKHLSILSQLKFCTARLANENATYSFIMKRYYLSDFLNSCALVLGSVTLNTTGLLPF